MRIYKIVTKNKAVPVIDDTPVIAHGIVAQEYLSDDEPEFDIEHEADRYAFQRWYEDELEADFW